MPSKKAIGWVVGTALVLGAGGFVLAKYNTNSMAHVMYEKITGQHAQAEVSSKTEQRQVESTENKTETKSTKQNSDQLTKLLKQENFKGSYAVMKNGKIAITDSMGKGTADKYYQVADLENMLTAAAILKLVDEGKLSLSTPISKYYSTLDSTDTITVSSLLKMTSGLSNNATPSSQLTNVLSWNISNAQSGTNGVYNYEEINYVLLEGIISQVTGGTYQAYIKKEFLEPYDLDQVKFVSSVSDSKLATPYNGSSKVSQTTLGQEMNAQMGRNQVMATPAGFLKLTKILVQKYGDQTSFTATTATNFTGQLIKSDAMFYGSGGIVGYRASVAISKDGKTGIMLMSNHSNGKDNLTQLVKNCYTKLD